jgi:hypothetical protein
MEESKACHIKDTRIPVQNPETLKSEIEAGNFKFQQMLPYKVYGVFFFTKKA